MQVFKYASMQVFKYVSMQVCKNASLKYAGMQVCRYAGMQVCKYASRPWYHMSTLSFTNLWNMTNKGMVELKAGPGYTYTTAEKDSLIWWIIFSRYGAWGTCRRRNQSYQDNLMLWWFISLGKQSLKSVWEKMLENVKIRDCSDGTSMQSVHCVQALIPIALLTILEI